MDDCLAELKAYKAVHGHTHVKHSENESLAKFCHNVRYAYNNPKGSNLMKLTEDMVSSLNALGFQWNTNIRTLFEERLDDLRAYKAVHGDVNVKRSEDKSLYTFCQRTKHAYNNPEATHTMKLTQDRVSSLGALGFQWWNINTSFEERLDDLRAYKSVHGDVNVKRSKDKSLYGFCQHIKDAYNNPEATHTKLTQDRVSSLEALGFTWVQRNYLPFEERLDYLRAYKAVHGDANVKRSKDKSLTDSAKISSTHIITPKQEILLSSLKIVYPLF